MKKKEITTLLTRMIQEIILEYFKTRSHTQKYRRSKLHPAEIEKRAKEKAIRRRADPDDIPLIFKKEPISSPSASYEIPEIIKNFLESTLQTMPKEPVAIKILQGIPIGKKEAMLLVRNLMKIPHFPIQQPRKLMNLLILLSVENQKH